MSRQAEIEHPANSDDNDPTILRVSVASRPPCSFTQAEDLVKHQPDNQTFGPIK